MEHLMASFLSHADNFVNAVSSNVDPRTGQYSCTVTLGHSSNNDFRGPKLPLMMGYTPNLGDNYGLGTGWTLNFSTLNKTKGVISASNGESYGVNADNELTKAKFPGFHFTAADDYCRIEHSDGSVEILDGIGSEFQIKCPTKIYSDSGAAFTLN